MGVVYAATHVLTKKPVALKWLARADPVARERLVREAQSAGRLDHPNVIDVYDVGEHGDATFLVMERLNGTPMSAALRGTPMTPHDAIRLVMPAIRGLAAAHALGVIHRDVKPENLFLCESRDGSAMTVKVVDFGISKSLVGDELGLTAEGVVIGTPIYMAPEQLSGGDLDGRADQYAIACVLYEMLEGVPPFEASSFEVLAAEKLAGDPRPFAQPLPRRLRKTILKAMSRRKRDRFESMEALGTALEPYADGVQFRDTDTDWSDVHTSVPDLLVGEMDTTTPNAVTRSRPWVPIAAAVLLTSLALGVGAYAAFGDQEEAATTTAPSVSVPRVEVAVRPQPELDDERSPRIETPAAEEAEPTEMRSRPRRRRARHRAGSLSLMDF